MPLIWCSSDVVDNIVIRWEGRDIAVSSAFVSEAHVLAHLFDVTIWQHKKDSKLVAKVLSLPFECLDQTFNELVE